MPTVGVSRDELFKALGRVYSDEEFDELCFEFGIELDEITSEKLMKSKESGKDQTDLSEEVIYKIEIPANRYDLLCLEGLSRALMVFLEKKKPPVYKAIKPASNHQQFFIKPETREVRPFAVAAILRGVTFNPVRYQSFIDLQEKLHQNICRKRTLVAIGTHDLDTIEGPFTYEALPPEQIIFAPLNQDKVMNAKELMSFYETDSHLRKYLPIIRDKPRYPVIYDKNRIVLSMPPIINSNHSKITLNTKNVFIECTATDLTKAKVVLNTMVTMFSEYSYTPFETEQVEVIDSDNKSEMYPQLENIRMEASIDYINKAVGIDLSPEKVAGLLEKMCLHAQLDESKKNVLVDVPPTRSDILHACDIMEDVAIAYGFNNLRHTIPKTNTFGQPFPVNKLSDLLRREVAYAGYTEILTFALCSLAENFDFLRKVDDNSLVVKIANPKTEEFQVARTTLIPGILKTVASNKKMGLPMKLFEISDVVVKDRQKDVGAKNVRRLCAIHINTSPGFEIIKGLLDRVMEVLNVQPSGDDKSKGFHIVPQDDSTFFPGRCARVIYNGQDIGVFGVLHPEVLISYELTYPASLIEIDLECFL